MGATMTILPDGTYPPRTTSRRLGRATKTTSQTKGKEKGERCQKSALKTWGMFEQVTPTRTIIGTWTCLPERDLHHESATSVRSMAQVLSG
jgi:hypothetical protein